MILRTLALLFCISLTHAKTSYECESIKIKIVSPDNAGDYLEQAFNKYFGGTNIVVLDQDNINGFGGYLKNKSGARDMDILLNTGSFVKNFEFVGVTLAAMVKGTARGCWPTP